MFEHEREREREHAHKNGAEHSRKMNVKSKMNTDSEISPPEQLQLDNSDKSLGSFRCTRVFSKFTEPVRGQIFVIVSIGYLDKVKYHDKRDSL